MRKICGLIVLALLFSLFAACSEDPENFDVDFSGNDNGEYDLGGIEILYRSNLDSGNGGVEISENYLGYVLETGFSDLAMQRVRELENKYNFKLNVTTQKADIVTMSAGGMSFADIFLSPSFYFFSWSKTGLLTGISKLADYIDYKDSKKMGICTSSGINDV